MSEWDEELVEATLRDHAEPTYDWRDEQICIHSETPEWPCAELRLARIAVDLRAQLAQRDAELTVLRAAAKRVTMMWRWTDADRWDSDEWDESHDSLAALSDDQEGRDE